MHHHVRGLERGLFGGLLLQVGETSFLGHSLRHVVALWLLDILWRSVKIRSAIFLIEVVDRSNIVAGFEAVHVCCQYLLVKSSLREIFHGRFLEMFRIL